jgi:hypothetical protein
MRCIKVEVEAGKSNLLIKSRIESFLEICIEECMPSLYFKAILPYMDTNDQFIPLEGVLSTDISQYPLESQAKFMYSSWLKAKGEVLIYDYFLSYRWGGDSQLVLATHDRLSLFPYPSATEDREVKVFLDHRRMKAGDNFKTVFAKSILSSTVVIPFISFEAMNRMILKKDSTEEDSVLIEWILALEGVNSETSNIKKLFPVFIGRRDKTSGSLSNLFADPFLPSDPMDHRNIIQCLPDSPADKLLVTSLAKARVLLTENGVQPSDRLDQMTIKSIVESLRDQLGLFLNKCARQNDEFFVEEICRGARNILKDHVTAFTVKDIFTSPLPVAGMKISEDGQGAESYQKLWEMIHTVSKVKDMSSLTAYLEEISLTEASELQYLNDEIIDSICLYLKTVPSITFKKIWKTLTNDH